MWDRIFTASVAASGISFVVFLVGWYLFDLPAITMAGATLIGVTGVTTAVSGFVLVLKTKVRV